MVVLGLDPGREKMGAALVQMPETKILARGIMAPNAGEALSRLVAGIPFSAVAVGNSTGHRELVERLREWLPSLAGLGRPLPPVVLVDERNSTLEARTLYWTYHPPSGLKKLIPLSLQTPPLPVDDFAAAIVASRALAASGYICWNQWQADIEGAGN